ncbi:alkaline phosphatase D family protein [Uliginosibacterium sp. H3]|uniref:Alkaline phosphatase D family protein n=1 Tax=Uliginosibacterium silvisoli TaxID=3114758 RepID=A0ABU6JZS3_9RHOO|nr:alkaline phosphatase D family protein [Uliginosibacterium sp. H3]
MKLSKPTVGPIVGYTTSSDARVWFRGQFEAVVGGYRRCFGAVQWGEKGKPASTKQVKVGKLSPNFDMTGVYPLTGLKPDKEYEYKVGWFLADADLDSARAMPQFDWDALETYSFRTATDKVSATRSYAVGSCRYLLRLFGGLIFDDRGDKTFDSILRQHEQNPISAVLMIGDQIYADDLNFVAPDETLDKFLARYQTVFSQEHVSRLMSRVPTYMILDDHEIEDNWPNKATTKDMTTTYPHAIHAYQVYQASHSPVFEMDSSGWITGTPTRFWYNFSDGCADWFVMDVRTERIWNTDPAQRQMIKKGQMAALLAWLSDGSGRAKMVVSSVPFIPDLTSDADDKWGAYLPERTQILDHILKNKIRKVSFVSGDVHCSFTAQLTSPSDPDFKVFSIISSSFFWPYPHMEQSDFVLKGALTVPATAVNQYVIGKASQMYSTDNFARLDIAPDGVTVNYFGRKGESLGKAVKLAF